MRFSILSLLAILLSAQSYASPSINCEEKLLRSVGKIYYNKHSTAETWHGTGFFVQSCLIVTNAHVVLGREKMIVYSQVLSRIPEMEMKAVNEVNEEVRTHDLDFQLRTKNFTTSMREVLMINLYDDVAVLKVSPCSEGQTEVLSLYAGSEPPSEGVALLTAGFPSKNLEADPVLRQCSIQQMTASNILHDCDTAPGQSGSPLVLADTCHVVGVHKEGARGLKKAAYVEKLIRRIPN
ncbi:trypsin-like serine peptidase [Bdellovibrio svalbardensis]|uniref:Serine protease n=1 Tax=Bdellovibrio svalbardensis TaxID=2972972 RepID=A0ABT6DLX7_9BACT|nr:serine protease [Bdellovibrio svalbardensis]MDG0817883.1 serine protease [Bdellovibrio svalbardensis]